MQCSTTAESVGDGGVTGGASSFSNQVTRPDLGALVLSSTMVLGDPLTISRSITLNGNPL